MQENMGMHSTSDNHAGAHVNIPQGLLSEIKYTAF